MDEAEQCDRILFMDKGQKIIEGRPKVLKETTPGAHNLEDAFIYYMKQARSQWYATNLGYTDKRVSPDETGQSHLIYADFNALNAAHYFRLRY